jgi:dihydrolipoamide dehydrogenase
MRMSRHGVLDSPSTVGYRTRSLSPGVCTVAETFDVTVIGSGPGGYVTAIKCAQLGLKTAIVEKQKRLGGTCTLWGCIPTKALLRTAEVMDTFKEAKEFGVDIKGEYALNFVQAYKRKEDVVSKNVQGIEYLMRKNKITVHMGHGRLAGKGKVEVTGDDGKKTVLETKSVIIATGSAVRNLPGIDPDGQKIVTSDSILGLKTQPKSLIVIGAGAVGMEFASVFDSFGSKVTVLEMANRLLPIEDEDSSKEIEKAYRKRKIEFHTDTKVEKVEKTATGVKVTVTKGGASQVLEAEMLLSAAGRRPVTEELGLEKTAVKLERGYILVDTMFRTGEPNVYAIGDCIPTPALAHVASYEGIVAAEHIAGKNPQPVNYDRTPNATYCHPEVASVGLTEKKAKERGYEVKTGTFPFSAIGKARILGESWGFVKIVADKKYDEVLGVHLVGPHATELLAEACLGLRLETTVEEIEKTMHAHPTLSEAFLEAAHAALGHTLHM